MQQNLEFIWLEKWWRYKNGIGVIWAWVGDRCSKDFSNYHKQHKLHTHIFELMEGKRTLSSSNNIHEYIFRYYKTFYSKGKRVKANQHQRTQCFSNVHPSITKECNVMFTLNILNLEVHAIVRLSNRGIWNVLEENWSRCDKIPIKDIWTRSFGSTFQHKTPILNPQTRSKNRYQQF
jgi:hypothetical protein